MMDSLSWRTALVMMLTGTVGSGDKVGTAAGVSRLPFSSPKVLLICSATLRLSTFPTTISVMASGVYHF